MNPTAPESNGHADAQPSHDWRKPAFEVVCLACELSAYAPDDGGPLF